jgi:gluconokinase
MVIVLMGVSGSGKTTTGKRLARDLGWAFRDADTFHPAANIEKMSRAIPLTDEDRWPWLAAIAAWMDELVVSGQSGIVSCSALKRAYRESLLAGRPAARLVHLAGSQDMIAARLQRRQRHFMPASLLQSQFDALEPPQPEERAVVVSVRLSPPRVAAEIRRRLGLALPKAGGDKVGE